MPLQQHAAMVDLTLPALGQVLLACHDSCRHVSSHFVTHKGWFLQADGSVAEGFEGVGELMPPGLFDNGRPGRGEMALGWEELSGKLALVARLLAVLRSTCDDK